MTPSLDAFFRIGSTHEVCQDYALALQARRDAKGPLRTLAAVADGCSGEAHTDVGARLILHGTVTQWAHVDALLNLEDWVERKSVEVSYGVSLARAACQHVGVPTCGVTATVALVEHHDADPQGVRGAIFGDGAISLRTPDWRLVVVEVIPPSSETGSMPAYPTYDPVHVAHYLDKTNHVPTTVRLTHLDQDGRVVAVEDLDPTIADQTQVGDTFTLRVLQGRVQEFPWPRPTVAIRAEGFDLATAWSDGSGTGTWRPSARNPEWSSFHDRPPEGAGPLLYDLSRISLPQGRFLLRRAVQACKNWAHSDDLSGAAIYLGDNP